MKRTGPTPGKVFADNPGTGHGEPNHKADMKQPEDKGEGAPH